MTTTVVRRGLLPFPAKPHISYRGQAGWRCEGPRAVVYSDSPAEALRGYLDVASQQVAVTSAQVNGMDSTMGAL